MLKKISEPRKGAIYDREAYLQSKLVDCSGWANREMYGKAILPRGITPSDIDVVMNPGMFQLDNGGHVLCIELSTKSATWANLSRGQYLAAQSMVTAGQGKIAAAACILPLTERQELGYQLGMRHRAAIGLTEVSDAIVIVVSEETRAISLAYNGEILRGLSQDDLTTELNRIYLKPAAKEDPAPDSAT